MTVIYAWLVYKQCTQTTEIQKEFYSYLAGELIDNVYDITGTRQASKISRGETSRYPERNRTVVAENGMLYYGA